MPSPTISMGINVREEPKVFNRRSGHKGPAMRLRKYLSKIQSWAFVFHHANNSKKLTPSQKKKKHVLGVFWALYAIGIGNQQKFKGKYTMKLYKRPWLILCSHFPTRFGHSGIWMWSLSLHFYTLQTVKLGQLPKSLLEMVVKKNTCIYRLSHTLLCWEIFTLTEFQAYMLAQKAECYRLCYSIKWIGRTPRFNKSWSS